MYKKKSFDSLKNITKLVLFVVEDSEEDYEILKRVVNKKSINCKLVHCETGKEALKLLLNQGNQLYQNQLLEIPSLILLDLNLPGIDGKEVLEQLKSHSILKLVPVVIFTTSSNPKDIEDCYQRGANAYVIKPMNFSKLEEHIEVILKHWLDVNYIDIEPLKAMKK